MGNVGWFSGDASSAAEPPFPRVRGEGMARASKRSQNPDQMAGPVVSQTRIASNVATPDANAAAS
ncbi:hypothetical protein SAMN04488125_101184 [Methylorubrum salsuginis]|uniref:Uncharacterized protein n=1 Tax=Methylorubrum salsuginis TaxID=414703 RepID=A0A1I3YFT5_9HYPH|nr:hypothetical protein SAMN04488125_101184 [Methylorubrum salsuginis]